MMIDGRAARVLVVEDDVLVAQGLAARLEAAGYDIAGLATSGEAAIAMARDTHPDLLLTDIMLPGELDGIETAGRIRETQRLPVLYLTNYADRALFERAKIDGPSGYLLKPYNDRELMLAIELALHHEARQRGQEIRHAAETSKLRQAEQAARADASSAQAELAKVFERITDGFVALDTDWSFTYVNARASEMFGRPATDLIGRNIWQVFPQHDGQPFQRTYEAALQTQLPASLEAFHAPWARWFENHIYPAPDGLSIFFQDVTERHEARAKLEKANTRLRQLSASLLEAQDAERSRLARDLHDDVGQTLTAIKFSLHAAAQRPPAGGPESALTRCIVLVESALERLRSLVTGLRPLMLDDLGLVAALRAHVSTLAAHVPAALDFNVATPLPRLPPGIETTAFRIAQEAINNALRHADAARIDVALRLVENHLELTVRDDGRGFDLAAAERGHGGLGLISMRERAEMAGGALHIVGQAGAGTTLTARLPLPAVSR